MKKKTYIKVELVRGGQSAGFFIEDPAVDFNFSDIQEMESNDCYKLSPYEMDEKDFKALPEFEGF